MAIVFIVAAFVFGVYVGESRVPAVERVLGISNKGGDPLSLDISTADQVDFAPFWRVWNTLDTKFVPRGTSTREQIEAQEKVWGAIAGLVDAYDDPYTTFFKPEETEIFKESARGSFEGVGMVVGIENEQLVVVAPFEDSPAMRAGIQAGDIIVKIDGIDSVSFSTDKAVDLIRGERGTEVVLHVRREGEADLVQIPITRGQIDIPSTNTGVVSREVTRAKDTTTPLTKEVIDEETGEVEVVPVPVTELPEESVEVVEQDFFFLRLFNFSESSVRSFKTGLEEFAESDADTLIIDLRGNPGGFLQSAIDMASYFIPEGEVVVREVVGADRSERVHVSKGHDLLREKDVSDIVVLVNRGSASASEILAGALQEYGVATVIGEKSFGKGSVQELVDITGDVSLKVTIARWYTPNGISISENGLTPDMEIDLSPPLTSFDPVFDAAVEYLGSK